MIDYLFFTPQSLARLGILGPLDSTWVTFGQFYHLFICGLFRSIRTNLSVSHNHTCPAITSPSWPSMPLYQPHSKEHCRPSNTTDLPIPAVSEQSGDDVKCLDLYCIVYAIKSLQLVALHTLCSSIHSFVQTPLT